MDRDNTYLEVNDYLDLYLLAKNLGDQTWQQELLKKLENYQSEEEMKQGREMSAYGLLDRYKEINTQIIDLYRNLYNNQSDQEIKQEIKELKRELIAISRKLYEAERSTQR